MHKYLYCPKEIGVTGSFFGSYCQLKRAEKTHGTRKEQTWMVKATCLPHHWGKRKYCLNSRLFLWFLNLPMLLFKSSRVLYHSSRSDFLCVGGTKALSNKETRVRCLKIQTSQCLKYKIMTQSIHTMLYFIYSHLGNENKPKRLFGGQLFTAQQGTSWYLPCSYIHWEKTPCKYCNALHPKMLLVFRMDSYTWQC